MTPLSQRDSKWASIKLGSSNDTTIGSHGCTITCIAMLAGLTPDVVNEKMKAAGSFANTNLVNWTLLSKAIPWLEFEWREYNYEDDKDNQRVLDAITNNGACLVEVDFDGKISTPKDSHWVLFIGNKQMIDPWTGVTKSTSYYPIKKGYAVINVKDTQEPMTDEILVKKSDFETLVTKGTWYDKNHEKFEQQENKLIEFTQQEQTYSQRLETIAKNLGSTVDWDGVIKTSAVVGDALDKAADYKTKWEAEIQAHKVTVESDARKFDSLNLKIDHIEEEHKKEIDRIRSEVNEAVQDYIKHKESFEVYMKATKTFSTFIQKLKGLFEAWKGRSAK